VKKYTLAISVSAAMLVLTGGIITYAVVSNSSPKKQVSKTTPQTSSTQTAAGGLGVSNEQSPTQGTASNGGGLSVDGSQAASTLQSNTNQRSSGSNASSLPGPSGFGEYEQYKNEQNAMYVDIQVGTGEEAVAGSQAVMVYKGWLTNGTLFDESKTNSQGQIEAFPFTIGSGQVIKGWDQGVVGMKVGGSRRIVVPPAAGYGSRTQGPIPANSVLVFDVQLVQIGQN
jgi:FKBP-type peptidyl-prolyl cis-trans isomerase FkpA